MVESNGLEIRRSRKVTVGSNPTLSAMKIRWDFTHRFFIWFGWVGFERGGFGNREVSTVAGESSREGESPFVGPRLSREAGDVRFPPSPP